jgi:Secretion system C-terminal sorting domain
MKTKFLHLMLLALAVLATAGLFAQGSEARPDKQYSLHIVKDENGKTEITDKTFASKEDLDAFVKANNLDNPEAVRPGPPAPPSPPGPPTTPTPPAKPTKGHGDKNGEKREKKIIIIEKEEGGIDGKTDFTIDLSQLSAEEAARIVQEVINLNVAKVEVQHVNEKENNPAPAAKPSTSMDENAQRTAATAQTNEKPANVANLKVYPNPGRQFHVACNVSKPCDVKLMLVDMNGKEVYEEAMNNYSGKMEKDINAAGLSKGTYVVDVEAAGERATTTIVLQ